MKKAQVLSILIAFFVLTFQNCGQDGGTTVGSLTTGRASTSQFILTSACQIVANCDPGATLSACQSSLPNDAGILTALGVPPQTFSSLAALQQAEIAGEVSPNSSAASLCATDITQLSCSSALVTGAYNSSASNPYSGLAQLLAQPCNSVYVSLAEAPTNVTATAWPYTALVSFTPPATSNGKTILGYSVTSTTASWISGTGVGSPIMVQGGNPGWDGNPSAFTVSALYSDGTTGTPSLPSNAVVPTAGSGPSTSGNVYVGGIFYWEGDFPYSGAGDPAYGDQTGNPQSDSVPSTYDIMCAGTGAAGFHPYAPTSTFDLTGFKYIQLDLEPTVAGTTWQIAAELPQGQGPLSNQGGIPSDSNGTYGPTPVVGKWATYKIPLVNLGVGPGTSNLKLYTFTLYNLNGSGPSTWYVNNVKFTSE